MEHWYVYYKLPAAEVDAMAARVKPMLAALGAATGAQCRLLARTEVAEGTATLMEVYDGIADAPAFGARLDAARARHGLPAATRRIERFRDL
jgi:Domain of unknown function (DUF4936)